MEINTIILSGYNDVAQAVVRDINERKQTQEKLSKNEKKYRSLCEQCNDSIFINGLYGRKNGTYFHYCTGIGISLEDQKKLFRPLTQLDSTYSRQYQGAGLGLALVKELVELYVGRIWIKSEVGKGSNLTFELPSKENI